MRGRRTLLQAEPLPAQKVRVVQFIRMEKNATTAGRGRGARNVPVLSWTEGAGGRGGRKKNGGCGKRRTVEIILQASGRLWKRRAGVETESPRGFKPKVRAYNMQISAAYGMQAGGRTDGSCTTPAGQRPPYGRLLATCALITWFAQIRTWAVPDSYGPSRPAP